MLLFGPRKAGEKINKASSHEHYDGHRGLCDTTNRITRTSVPTVINVAGYDLVSKHKTLENEGPRPIVKMSAASRARESDCCGDSWVLLRWDEENHHLFKFFGRIKHKTGFGRLLLPTPSECELAFRSYVKLLDVPLWKQYPARLPCVWEEPQ